MDTLYLRSSLFAVLLTSTYVLTNNAFSDASPQETGNKISSVSIEMKHPLALVHQQLAQARKNIEKSDTEALHKNLQTAQKILQSSTISQDDKTKNEVKALLLEIQQLQNEENKEGAIARLWHRSSALLEREVTKLSTSWSDSSKSSETLKHLIDARLHFNYAKHDLFVSHEADKVEDEINQTLAYLDLSSKSAKEAVKNKIIVIKKDIKHLLTDKANTEAEQNIIKTLSLANENMLKVSRNTTATLKIKARKIADEISSLKKNIIILEKEEQYNSLIKRLEDLDKFL